MLVPPVVRVGGIDNFDLLCMQHACAQQNQRGKDSAFIHTAPRQKDWSGGVMEYWSNGYLLN
jgi:hypothetical protein